MRALYCLGMVGLFLTFSCKPSANNTIENIDVNSPDIIWAKRTNFKVDFNDENDVKNIKVLDKNLAAILMEEAESKRLKVYDAYEDFLLSDDQVDNIFHKVDTVLVIDPDTDEEEEAVVRNDFDLEAVKKFRVVQEWYFKKSTGKLGSRLISVSPLIEKYGPGGDYRGDAPVFKILLD